MSIRLCLSCAVLALGVAARAATPPPELPVELFFKKPSFSAMTFSPDGKRLAYLVPHERRMNLAVIDLEKKAKHLLTNFKDNDVGSLRWANDTRIIYTKDSDGQEWSAVYAVNADGSDHVLLASGAEQRGTTKEWNQQFRGLLARLPQEPRYFLVLARLTGMTGDDVARMDLRTGRMTLDTANPGAVRQWILDRDRRVRIGVAQERQKVSVLLRNEKGGWDTLHEHHVDEPGWTPLGFDGDNRTLFVSSTLGRQTAAVYRYDTQTRTMGDLVCGDDTYDVDDLVYDEARRKVVGVTYAGDRQRFHWIDAEAEAMQRRLDASLPDTVNWQRHASPDGSRQLIHAASDRDPGVYYLFHRAAKRLEEIAVVRPEIDPERMAPMKPISYAARDGLTLHGYLTLPVGREPKRLPLVVHPHGGPYGIRDEWHFDPQVQFYANRGFAVLQIDYRGSGGYGREFERRGWKKWGLEMQDDITDGVRWAIAQGIADPQRVVIAGASYGGYAAMAGLAFTPELYRAGINYVGVVDIEELLPRGTDAGGDRLHWYATHIADPTKAEDRKRVHDTSPVHFADRIRAPVLMAYGKNDPRVRINQGYDMESALKKARKTYEMIIEADEGHGFRKEELAIAFFTRVDAFLKKYVLAEPQVKIGPSKVIEMPARTAP